VWVAKDASKKRYAQVRGKIVERTKAWNGEWRYTVEDSKGNQIEDVKESELKPE
jgi:hypothetical protein